VIGRGIAIADVWFGVDRPKGESFHAHRSLRTRIVAGACSLIERKLVGDGKAGATEAAILVHP